MLDLQEKTALAKCIISFIIYGPNNVNRESQKQDTARPMRRTAIAQLRVNSPPSIDAKIQTVIDKAK